MQMVVFSVPARGYEREWNDGVWSEADLARHMEAQLSYVGFADTVALLRRIVGRATLYCANCY